MHTSVWHPLFSLIFYHINKSLFLKRKNFKMSAKGYSINRLTNINFCFLFSSKAHQFTSYFTLMHPNSCLREADWDSPETSPALPSPLISCCSPAVHCPSSGLSHQGPANELNAENYLTEYWSAIVRQAAMTVHTWEKGRGLLWSTLEGKVVYPSVRKVGGLSSLVARCEYLVTNLVKTLVVWQNGNGIVKSSISHHILYIMF